MAETAPMIQYRNQVVQGFARKKSLLRSTATTEAVISGNQAVFLIANDNASVVTRGVNGNIPYGANDTSQVTCTLTERHATGEQTGFNIFQSQGPQREILQMRTINAINRDIDDVIIAELANATGTLGAAALGTPDLLLRARGRVRQANVTFRTGEVTALITPAFERLLLATPAFASADYISVKPLTEQANAEEEYYYVWAGLKIIVHTGLNALGTLGTANEVCVVYHKDAIGHAANSETMDVQADYDKKQDSSWSRATLYHGAKLLQNAGVLKINHDGSTL